MKKEASIATIIILISLIGKVLGFLRELLLANYFGTSSIVDMYLMSYTIPSILFGFLPAIGVGVTPVYFEIDGEKRRNMFINNILITSMLISLACITLTYIGSEVIVSVCAPGFSESAKITTNNFLKITVWAVFFNTPVQILVSFLNCKRDYINSNISNLTVSLTQAICIVVAAYTDPIFLPIGVVLPWLFQFLWLYISSIRQGFRPSLKVTKDINVKKLLLLAAPISISNIIVDLNGFVDKTLSSSLPEGRMSALNYAFTIRAVFVTVATTVLATIYYPRIAELTSEKNEKKIVELVEKLLDIIIVIVIPINVFCMLFGKEVIQIVLMRGNFDANSLTITLIPFIMYMLSLTIIVIRELIIRVMYANGSTKKNLYFGAVNVGINIILSLCLIGKMEHSGLALATSVAAICTFPLYMKELHSLVPGIHYVKRIKIALKVLLSSVIMGGTAYVVNIALKSILANTFIETLCRFVVCFTISVIVFIIMISAFHVEEVALVLGRIKRALVRRNHD